MTGGSVSLLPRARCLSLLGASAKMEHVKQIHAQMITTSLLLRDPASLCTLIQAYFKLQQPDPSHARLLFRTHPTAKPDAFTYTFLLSSCARLNALHTGIQLHALTLKTGLASHLALQTTTIHFYASCSHIHSARLLFDQMPHRTSATWNAMMSAYCTGATAAREALLLFRQMLLLHCDRDVRPTDRTAVVLLSACSQLPDLSLGISLHALIYKLIPHENCVYIGTALVDMYSKCGCLASTSAVFHSMTDRNVLTWSAMTAGLAFHGQGRAALDMLDEMRRAGVQPNAITFTSLLSACCHAGGLVDEGLELFYSMKSKFGIEPGMQHYGCVVDLLARAGMVEEAYGTVKRMPMQPDTVVWRALLSACNIHGCVELGEEIGRILLQLGQRSESMAIEDSVALSNLYASKERWVDVSTLREGMMNMGIQNRPGSSSFS